MPFVNRGFVVAVFAAGALVTGCADAAASASDPEPEAGGHVYLLAVGPNHVCASRRAGLYCWEADLGGDPGAAQGGAQVPVRVELDPSDVVELAAASGRTCIRRRAGTVACWGTNEQGQIGDGTRVSSALPVAAVGIEDARQLAIAADSTCALRADGSVACWGRSPEHAPESGALLPQRIAGLADVVELRGGVLDSYCARSATGSVQCIRFRDGAWTAPRPVEPLAGARAIALTFEDTLCGIVASGEVHCSGLSSDVSTPLIESAGSVQLRASGGLSACAKDAGARWHCWNVPPSANDGSPVASSPKVAVASDIPLVDLGISGFLVCGLGEDDSVACASANSGAARLRIVAGLPP